MKTKFKLITCLLLLLFIVGCSNQNPDPREREIIQLLNDKKYDEATVRANELYKGEDKKLAEILDYINDDIERELTRKQMLEEVYPSSKLEIQPGYTNEVKGDYYYITGRVKNSSNTDINYFEIQCNFLDKNGQVLDSDYTNDNLVLKPGELREFEIMHQYKPEYKRYELSIGDVK